MLLNARAAVKKSPKIISFQKHSGRKAVHLFSLFAPCPAPFDSPDLLLSVLEFQLGSFPNKNIRAPEENVWTAASYLK